MDFKPYKMGKYLLLERLAAGGMAEVYRAKSTGASGFEKNLAIKRILPEHLEDETFRKMFETEARIGSSLQHANIVQILDFVKFGETFLLVMEFVNGKNLRQVVNKLKRQEFTLPIECVLFIINETCKGLEYAHTKIDDYTGQHHQIIHRDMSPQNIMLAYDGSVKIVDFGIANCKDKIEHTKSGVIKGKFGYMSPEQAAGETLSPLSDLFSLGIIFWELLTGKRLFSAESDMATLRLIQDCVIPKPSQFNSRINSDLERIVMKSLSKSHHQRFPSAAAMQKKIQEYLAKHYPGFRGSELGGMMQSLFQDEIASEKRRLEQLSRQSIPFSQGNNQGFTINEELSFEPGQESSMTVSEQDSLSHITFVDENVVLPNVIQNNDPDSLTQKANITPSSLSRTEPGDPAKPPDAISGNSQEKTLVAIKGKLETDSRSARIEQILSHSSSASTLKKAEPEKSTDLSIGLISQEETEQNSTSQRQSLWTGTTPDVAAEDKSQSLPKISTLIKLASALSVVGVTVYLYHLLLSGNTDIIDRVAQTPAFETPVQVIPIEPRSTSSSGQVSQKSSTPPVSNCEIKFETDPPGALLIVDGIEKLSTPGVAMIPCGTSVNFSLQLPGFESISERIEAKLQSSRLFKTLKRLQTGNILLILNRRVKVMSGVTEYGETTPGKPFLIESLPANRPITLRFVNDVFGIDERRIFEIKPNINSTYKILLDEKK